MCLFCFFTVFVCLFVSLRFTCVLLFVPLRPCIFFCLYARCSLVCVAVCRSPSIFAHARVWVCSCMCLPPFLPLCIYACTWRQALSLSVVTPVCASVSLSLTIYVRVAMGLSLSVCMYVRLRVLLSLCLCV